MEMKNILIVTPSKPGVSETFIRAHIDQLDGIVFHLYGWELHYFTADGIPLRELYARNNKWYDRLYNFLPYYFWFRIKQKREKQQSDKENIKRYLRENNIQVVLAEYGTTGSFIAPLCKEMDIPLIVHFHGFDASRYEILEKFRDPYRFMFDYARNIIAVSTAMKVALVNIGCPEEKIIINTYGPHADFFTIHPNYHSDMILAVGRQTFKKAPYLTILAFQRVLEVDPDLKLVMIGDGEIMEVSRNMVKALGMEKNVILPGALGREKIMAYMKKSFLFIQHSLVATDGDSEGTPVGILEAMVAGLPVIATRHAGIIDIVVEGETGFLTDECDVDGMTDYLVQLAGNRKLAEHMGKSGRKHVSENFTMEKHIDTINGLISCINE